MNKVISSETMKKVCLFLLPAILTIVLVLSMITVVHATDTGVSSAKEEIQTEEMVASPAGQDPSEVAQEVTKKQMPGMEQDGMKAADQSAEEKQEIPEPAGKK